MAERQLRTSEGFVDAPESALWVVAHPDDIDFGSAGSVAALTAAGTRVAYCLATSGEGGDDDLTHAAADLAALRQAEQTAAAAEVGVSELHWLGHPDGTVEATLGLRRDIAAVIRRVRPEVVVTQSPDADWDRVYFVHPDHLAVARATVAAVYPDSRNPRTFGELLEDGLAPHTVSELWLFGAEPNRYVDITDTFDAKVRALRAHVSQTAEMDDLEGRLRTWASETAAKGGMSEGRLAEAFRVIAAT